MKKLFALLLVGLLFASTQPVLADSVVILSDAEMEDISAGDWVVVVDSKGNPTVVDVWYNWNDILLTDESQTKLEAVNNANAVDSAIAVQTNVSSVAGNASINVAVNGSNSAFIRNFNPAESSSSFTTSIESTKNSTFESKMKKDNFASSSESSGSIECGSSKEFSWNETLDVPIAYASTGETGGKLYGDEWAEAFTMIIDYDKVVSCGEESSCKVECSESANETHDICETTFKTSEDCSLTTEMSGKENRKSLSENNHIVLDETAQQLLKAVSNLNAVGSGAALQTNVASNVGVTGTITHSNMACVENGF